MKVYLVRVANDFAEYGLTHPLGVMYLSAYLKQHTDHEVRIKDQRGEQCSLQDVLDDIADWAPDVVGISAMTAEAKLMYRLAEWVKAASPATRVVGGGPHTSAFTEESLTESVLDHVVVGEGEETFEDLLAAYERGESGDGVAGTAYRKPDGTVALTEGRTYMEDLDDLPYPDWDAIDLTLYDGKPGFDLMNARKRQMSLFTSRACPFECIYCHNVFGKVFRARSPENVVGEITRLHRDYGVEEFLVLDDIFNIDLVRAKKIARMLIAEKMDISLVFAGGFKADLVDEELLDLLVEAGMERIAYAIESAAPRVQTLIKKGLDLDKVAQVIRWTARRGVIVRGYFMIGFPNETTDEAMASIEWAERSELTIAAFNRAMPFKGTELYDMAQRAGTLRELDYEQYNYDYSDNNLSDMPDAELDRLQRLAYRRFYGNPRRILNLVWRLPNKRQLPKLFAVWVYRVFASKSFKPKLVQGNRAAETQTLPVPT